MGAERVLATPATFTADPFAARRSLEAARPTVVVDSSIAPETPVISTEPAAPLASDPVSTHLQQTPPPTAPTATEVALTAQAAPLAAPSEASPPSTVASAPSDPPPAAPVSAPLTSGLDARGSAFLVALNAARASQGLGPLAATADLSGVASARASDMVANGYFAHVSPSGESWLTMLSAQGVQLASGGENLARVSGGVDQSVAVAIEVLMASPTHRANILNESFTEAGIAAVTDSEGTTTFVTIFGSR